MAITHIPTVQKVLHALADEDNLTDVIDELSKAIQSWEEIAKATGGDPENSGAYRLLKVALRLTQELSKVHKGTYTLPPIVMPKTHESTW